MPSPLGREVDTVVVTGRPNLSGGRRAPARPDVRVIVVDAGILWVDIPATLPSSCPLMAAPRVPSCELVAARALRCRRSRLLASTPFWPAGPRSMLDLAMSLRPRSALVLGASNPVRALRPGPSPPERASMSTPTATPASTAPSPPPSYHARSWVYVTRRASTSLRSARADAGPNQRRVAVMGDLTPEPRCILAGAADGSRPSTSSVADDEAVHLRHLEHRPRRHPTGLRPLVRRRPGRQIHEALAAYRIGFARAYAPSELAQSRALVTGAAPHPRAHRTRGAPCTRRRATPCARPSSHPGRSRARVHYSGNSQGASSTSFEETACTGE